MEPDQEDSQGGLRVDDRRALELRQTRMRMGVFGQADNSAYIEHGNTKVLATVDGPRQLQSGLVLHFEKMSKTFSPDRTISLCKVMTCQQMILFIKSFATDHIQQGRRLALAYRKLTSHVRVQIYSGNRTIVEMQDTKNVLDDNFIYTDYIQTLFFKLFLNSVSYAS